MSNRGCSIGWTRRYIHQNTCVFANIPKCVVLFFVHGYQCSKSHTKVYSTGYRNSQCYGQHNKPIQFMKILQEKNHFLSFSRQNFEKKAIFILHIFYGNYQTTSNVWILNARVQYKIHTHESGSFLKLASRAPLSAWYTISFPNAQHPFNNKRIITNGWFLI